MKVIGVLILVALSACSRPVEDARASAEEKRVNSSIDQTTPDKPDCDLYIRGVEPDQTLTPYPFIRPDQVASIDYLESSYPDGAGWMFSLTKDGGARMYQHTSKNVGSPIAIFCGTREISRPYVTMPFSGPVLIHLKDLNT